MTTKKTARTKMGRSQIETPSQRRNLHEHIVREARPSNDAFWRDGVAKVQAARLEKRREALVKWTMEARREYADLLKSLRDGKSLDAKSVQRYTRLAERFAQVSYATPTAADVHVDAPLTNLIVAWGQGEYVAEALLPTIPVDKRSGLVFKDDQATLQGYSDASAIAPGAPAPELDWTMDTQISYQVISYGRKKTLPDALVGEATAPMSLRDRTAIQVANQVALERELRVATLLQTATNYLAANRVAAAGTKWDAADKTDNEHMDDLETAHQAIADAIGKRGNTIVMNLQTAFALIRKTDFADRVKYVQSSMPETLLGLIGSYCMVENAYVGMARYKSSNPGQGTETYADVWTDAPAVLYVDPNPSEMYFGFGCSPATDTGTALSWRHPEPDRASDCVAYLEARDEVVLNNAAGAILQDVLT